MVQKKKKILMVLMKWCLLKKQREVTNGFSKSTANLYSHNFNSLVVFLDSE